MRDIEQLKSIQPGPHLWRLEGATQWRDLVQALELGIQHFLFDFRPTALNFLPAHDWLRLMEGCQRRLHVYALFEGESPGVLQYFNELVEQLRHSTAHEFAFEFMGELPDRAWDLSQVDCFVHLRGLQQLERVEWVRVRGLTLDLAGQDPADWWPRLAELRALRPLQIFLKNAPLPLLKERRDCFDGLSLAVSAQDYLSYRQINWHSFTQSFHGQVARCFDYGEKT